MDLAGPRDRPRDPYVPGQGVTLFLEPTNRANGLTRDLQGRLIACEHDSRRVTRQELDGSITVIANSFQGRRLNRPNDVVVKSDGCIYFTDPWTSPRAPEQWDLNIVGVYRITPDLGTMSLLVSDFVLPAWFERFRKPRSAIFDYGAHITEPFQVLPDAYLFYFEHAIASQLFPKKTAVNVMPAPRSRRKPRRKRNG